MASLDRTTVAYYENLKGVDFSRPPSLVDKNRSPYCLNLMPDSSTNPVKRYGWQTAYSLDGEVYNLWFCTINDSKYILCHCGDKIYSLGEETKVLKSGVSKGKGCGFYAIRENKGCFYILTTGEYLVFDGNEIHSVADNARVPLVSIAKYPQGGGESYEDINLLTPLRQENFIGTQADLIYQLGADNIEQVHKVEVMDSEGGRVVLEKETDYTVNLSLGRITFVSSHPAPIEGHDNIFVVYSKNVDGYREKVEKCTISTMFGLGGENRVFLSGNPDYPHIDRWSGVFDPSYFSDLDYSVVGSGQTAVMGYLKLGEYLGIVKEGNGQDVTLFLRSAQQTDGKAMFVLQAGISGTGAISRHCFALLNDEPLFLSSEGIFAVVNSVITSQKVIANRSYQIDARLTKEKNLHNAVACVWKNFYVLSVNGNCYLLDSRQIVPAQSGEKNSRYEAYFWNNIDANCFAVEKDVLWFGTKDGKVRFFKDESFGTGCYSDDGQAIHAVWKTPLEDEGMTERFKTLQRKGCMVTLMPFEASSCTVYCSVDGGAAVPIQTKNADITQLFRSVDFTRFTFNANTSPQDIYFYTRKKRYKRIQFIFENNRAEEGFGIQKITKQYKVTNYSKNRR